jgi:predicted RNA-binding protein
VAVQRRSHDDNDAAAAGESSPSVHQNLNPSNPKTHKEKRKEKKERWKDLAQAAESAGSGRGWEFERLFSEDRYRKKKRGRKIKKPHSATS